MRGGFFISKWLLWALWSRSCTIPRMTAPGRRLPPARFLWASPLEKTVTQTRWVSGDLRPNIDTHARAQLLAISGHFARLHALLWFLLHILLPNTYKNCTNHHWKHKRHCKNLNYISQDMIAMEVIVSPQSEYKCNKCRRECRSCARPPKSFQHEVPKNTEN